jgi:hypothetical protein
MTTPENNIIINDETTQECDICGDLLNTFTTLKCNHKFHYECILDWYKECKNNKKGNSKLISEYIERSCPYCKSDGGYLKLPDQNNDTTNIYIPGIHKLIIKSRDTKLNCLGIAKSTGKNCKLKGKPEYNGFCTWHKNQAKI